MLNLPYVERPKKGAKQNGIDFFIRSRSRRATRPPAPRPAHRKVVLLLSKVAEVVALVDLRLHIVRVDLVGIGVDEPATWEQLCSTAMRSIATRRASSLNASIMPANQNNDRSVKSVAKV